jgi:hypothetical protein
VIIPPGKLPRWPDGHDAYRRIVADTVTVPDGGGAELVDVVLQSTVAA